MEFLAVILMAAVGFILVRCYISKNPCADHSRAHWRTNSGSFDDA